MSVAGLSSVSEGSVTVMDEQSKQMRQRVFETLALIADKESQHRYQLKAPNVDVPAELFNQWEDCFLS